MAESPSSFSLLSWQLYLFQNKEMLEQQDSEDPEFIIHTGAGEERLSQIPSLLPIRDRGNKA